MLHAGRVSNIRNCFVHALDMSREGTDRHCPTDRTERYSYFIHPNKKTQSRCTMISYI